jgi:hypothetical protein
MVDDGLTFREIRGILLEMRISLIWSREVGKVAIMKRFSQDNYAFPRQRGGFFKIYFNLAL